MLLTTKTFDTIFDSSFTAGQILKEENSFLGLIRKDFLKCGWCSEPLIAPVGV